jgi:type II secretory pathway pseudopilin PulG
MDMRAARGRRGGYAILWALMVIAIIAVLMAAVAPSLMQSNEVSRVTDAATKLKLVSNAVDSFAKYIRHATGVAGKHEVPGSLTDLETLIAIGGTSGCSGVTYSNFGQNNWTTNGPFVQIYMPPNGLWTSIGRIAEPPTRIGAQATFDLTIPNVSLQDAQMLDQIVDGNQNSAADTVKYGPATNGLVTLTYTAFFPFTAC